VLDYVEADTFSVVENQRAGAVFHGAAPFFFAWWSDDR
jgi:hypothetical protein